MLRRRTETLIEADFGTTGLDCRYTETQTAIFGTPDTWAAPLVLKVVEKKSRRGYKFFDLELVSEDKRK